MGNDAILTQKMTHFEGGEKQNRVAVGALRTPPDPVLYSSLGFWVRTNLNLVIVFISDAYSVRLRSSRLKAAKLAVHLRTTVLNSLILQIIVRTCSKLAQVLPSSLNLS